MSARRTIAVVAPLLLLVCAVLVYRRFEVWLSLGFVSAAVVVSAILGPNPNLERLFRRVLAPGAVASILLAVQLYGPVFGWLGFGAAHGTDGAVETALSPQDELGVVLVALALSSAIVLILLAIIFFVASQMLTEWVEAVDPTTKPAAAGRLLRDLYLGFNKAVLMVREGKFETTRPGADGLMQKIGGPGTLIVHHGNAAVLERGGKFTRIARCGITQLALFERIRAPLDLQVQQRTISVNDVYTRDGVPLSIDLDLRYQICQTEPPPPEPALRHRHRMLRWLRALTIQSFPKPRRRRVNEFFTAVQRDATTIGSTVSTAYSNSVAWLKGSGKPPSVPQDLFSVSDGDLLGAVYKTDNWHTSLHNAARNFVRDILGARTFDTIFEWNEASNEMLPRSAIRETLVGRLNRRTIEEQWGMVILSCDITSLTVPAAARKRMLERWEADWEVRTATAQKQATITRGEADAAAASAQEAARARASAQMVAAITGLLRDPDTKISNEQLDRIIRLRLIDAMEKMAGEHVSGMMFPGNLLDILGVGDVLPKAPEGGASDTPPPPPDPVAQ
jgi:regulator of protease activity HflC (stomatin/prohibitin superfamily)